MSARKHFRYRLELPVILAWQDDEKGWQRRVSRALDLSAWGAFIFAPEAPRSGTLVRLQALLPLGSTWLHVWICGQRRVVPTELPGKGHGEGFAVVGPRFELRRGKS